MVPHPRISVFLMPDIDCSTAIAGSIAATRLETVRVTVHGVGARVIRPVCGWAQVVCVRVGRERRCRACPCRRVCVGLDFLM
eukprot:6543848-Prymnesium_polylepis.1